ncbi:MAG: Glycosyltransferase, group 1 family protein [Candidatus Uhrbacteria bacterium GW2011_GWE2_41_1153]|nr:MAG: Glycosyltransferase, group 1 family protein [Candidatus Uhrbacteria bacterium GW2011_GWE2_41_1153]
MRIIHAHKYFYKRRGAEHYMLDLMNMQEQDGHQVVPFSMQYPKNLPSAWDGFFVSEIQTEQGSRNLYQALKHLIQTLFMLIIFTLIYLRRFLRCVSSAIFRLSCQFMIMHW